MDNDENVEPVCFCLCVDENVEPVYVRQVYNRISYEIQKEHLEPLLRNTELYRIAYLDGTPCTIEFSKDTFINEGILEEMIPALEAVSKTWKSNGLFTGTIRTEINLTTQQIFDTSLITKDAEMAKLYETILAPFRDHLETTLGPLAKFKDRNFTVRLGKYIKGGKQPLHSDTLRCGCL
jgi:hypothetical protein